MNKTASIGGKIGITLFFSVFLAMGSLFVFFIGREFVRSAETYFWKKAECKILFSEAATVSDDENPYRFNVEYQYSMNGQTYISDDYTSGEKQFSDYGKAQSLSRRYHKDSQHTCYVNASDPQQAVLKRGNLAFGLVVLFPMIFVAIGAGGIWAAWFGKAETSKSEYAQRSITGKNKSKQKGPVFFFGLFFLAGFAFFFFAFLRPAYKVLLAKKWDKVPCKVISSDVRSHSSSDGTTYSVDILYSYEYQGQSYKSNRYEFLGGSSSGYKGKKEIIRQYPKGSQSHCYVNPQDPQEAVLNRGFTLLMYILAGFSSVFMFAGLIGMIVSARQSPGKASFTGASSLQQSFSQGMNFDSAQAYGPVTLKPKATPLGKFFGMLFFTIFWNGFLVVAASLELKHVPSFSEMIGFLNKVPFLWIFQIVGILIFAGVVYQLLALFNPQPRLMLGSQQIRLGENADLRWKMKGKASRISELKIVLEGREEATYRRGTNTYTDRKTFYKDTVVSTQNALQIAAGEGVIRIPPDTMHTFKSSNNKILWFITVHGDIAKWPDVKDEFEIIVEPFA